MRKSPALLLLLLNFNFSSLQSSEICSECTLKERNLSYLDVAIKMINEVKEAYPPCSTNKEKLLDCADLYKAGHNESGIYTVWPKNRVTNGKSIEVFCDMQTDGGGWTVIQRRGNFSRPVDYFYKDWASYKQGFGNIDQDFWLGNDNIFALSNQKLYSIRFDLKDVEGNSTFAVYDTFWIDDEDHKYAIHLKGYRGDAGDSMQSHDGLKFSTKDQDNDNWPNNCAESFKGAWWYGECHKVNLNGLDLRGKHESHADGINWHSFKGHYESLDTTEIKIREKLFRSH